MNAYSLGGGWYTLRLLIETESKHMMTLREQLKELGGVGAPVKIGFTRSWIWCGRLCENYELLFNELYQQECVKHVQNLNDITYRITHFDKIWNEIINTNLSELEHDMDYPRLRFEYKKFISELKDSLLKRELEYDHMIKQINTKETSSERKSLYERIRVKRKTIANIRGELRILTRKYREIENITLTDEEKEQRRKERRALLQQNMDTDWIKCHEKRDELTIELSRPAWLDREVLEIYNSIDAEEIEGTKCISLDGITIGKYWFSAEMKRDKQMQRLIAEYSGVSE